MSEYEGYEVVGYGTPARAVIEDTKHGTNKI